MKNVTAQKNNIIGKQEFDKEQLTLSGSTAAWYTVLIFLSTFSF